MTKANGPKKRDRLAALDELSLQDLLKHLDDSIFRRLSQQVCVFREVFGYETSVDRAQLLNDTAGGAFIVIFESLIDGIVVGIGRLIDHADFNGRPNLSLSYLARRLLQLGKIELGNTVSDRLSALAPQIQLIQAYRNRLVAHT